MQYTTEQTKKILGYIKKKQDEHKISSEELNVVNEDGKLSISYETSYGAGSDLAIVKLVTHEQLDDFSLISLIRNYKNLKAFVYLTKWDVSWVSETDDEVLDCLEAITKAETGMNLSQFIDKEQTKMLKEKEEQVKKELTLQERFFKEN